MWLTEATRSRGHSSGATTRCRRRRMRRLHSLSTRQAMTETRSPCRTRTTATSLIRAPIAASTTGWTRRLVRLAGTRWRVLGVDRVVVVAVLITNRYRWRRWRLRRQKLGLIWCICLERLVLAKMRLLSSSRRPSTGELMTLTAPKW